MQKGRWGAADEDLVSVCDSHHFAQPPTHPEHLTATSALQWQRTKTRLDGQRAGNSRRFCASGHNGDTHAGGLCAQVCHRQVGTSV